MEILESVRKAFATLGERLYFFEAKFHFLPNSEHEIHVNQHDYDYLTMIDKIGRDVNRFEITQVYEVAYEYLLRTHRVLEELVMQQRGKNTVPESKWKMWNSEIYEYLHQLLAILEARDDAYHRKIENKGYANDDKLIQLPDNYTITDLQAHFKPRYTHPTIALLLYYMSKVGILPLYHQREFGKIASLFGFHSKTIEKDFRNLNSDSKSDLIKVKSVAENLLESITDDLAKARRK